ncbi:MAG: NAD(P)/FAD-dependent oxidoreductase [Solirubrobacteraceae bacterium]
MTAGDDVVVVGGGVQGVVTALHLRESGVSRVRLLERHGLLEATSGAGAGFVAIWAAMTARPYGEEELAVERYGLGFYRALHERGHDIDFRQNGLLLVGADDEAFEQFRAVRRERFDPDTAVVDAERIEELTGGAVLAAGVRGGVFQPAAAQVFTPKVGTALAARAREAGITVERGRPATGLEVRRGRVTGVRTQTGTVASGAVVLAAGAWSNQLLRPHGARLPQVPHVTSRAITEPLGVPRTMPALMLSGVIEGGPRLWVREHQGGLLWGVVQRTYPRHMLIGREELPLRLDAIPLDGVQEAERVARAVSRVMPALSRYRRLALAHGAPCFTPDHRALVGPVPGIDGLYAIAGDNEAGVTHGPGFAKVLADHIVRGSSELTDLEGWRIDRFGERYVTEAEVAEGVELAAAG